jgi:hypothetical protein
MDRVVNDDIFVALATRPDLQSLEFQKAITAELVSLAKSRQYQNYGKRQLFPQLRKLVCTGEADGFFSLLPHLTQLTHLETTLLGSHVSSVEISGSLLDIATYCPNLKFLNLECTAAEDIYLSPNELVELVQRLQHLEDLHISGDRVSVPGLETVHITKIAEALPNVKRLTLAFQCTLTEAALVEIGRICGRTLTECMIWGSYNLSNLEESDISFPLLKELSLGKVVPSGIPDDIATEAANNVRFLRRVVPNLETVHFEVEDSFSIEISSEINFPGDEGEIFE